MDPSTSEAVKEDNTAQVGTSSQAVISPAKSDKGDKVSVSSSTSEQHAITLSPEDLAQAQEDAAWKTARKRNSMTKPTWLPTWCPKWLSEEPDPTTWGKVRTACNWVLTRTIMDGETKAFELFIGCVIIFNVILMIFEADATAICTTDPCVPAWIDKSNLVVIVIFTLEVLIRLEVERHYFMFQGWNLFDLAIVLAAWAGMVDELQEGGGNDSQSQTVQLFRIVRVARVIRMAKILSNFPTLLTMIRGFSGAMNAMCWGLVVILFLIIIWSILAVEVMHTKSQKIYPDISEDNEYCALAFSSVIRATLLFFQTLVAGDSWGACAIPMIQESPITFCIFAAALVTIQLGFTNLVLAIIVDKAHEAREADQDALKKARKKEQEDSVKKWEKVIEDMDADKSGSVDMYELMVAADTPEFGDILAIMDIDKEELRQVFTLLDKDSSGCVSYKEFVDAFHKAQNQDWRVYLMLMKLETGKLHTEMRNNFKRLERLITTPEADRPVSRGRSTTATRAAAPSTEQHSAKEAQNESEVLPMGLRATKVLQTEGVFMGTPPKKVSAPAAAVAQAHSVGARPSAAASTVLSVSKELEVLRGRLEARLAAVAAETSAKLEALESLLETEGPAATGEALCAQELGWDSYFVDQEHPGGHHDRQGSGTAASAVPSARGARRGCGRDSDDGGSDGGGVAAGGSGDAATPSKPRLPEVRSAASKWRSDMEQEFEKARC